jgi:hypothetical protein
LARTRGLMTTNRNLRGQKGGSGPKRRDPSLFSASWSSGAQIIAREIDVLQPSGERWRRRWSGTSATSRKAALARFR